MTAAALLSGLGVATASEHMPPGAFLVARARSRSDVLRQVSRSATLLARYARVYRCSPAAVLRLFRTMHLITLKRDFIGPVYYVHAGERIGSRVRRVRKGTGVFVTSYGAPLLIRICGNPFNARVPLAAAPSDLFVPDYEPYEPLDTLSGQPLLTAGPEAMATTPVEPDLPNIAAPLLAPDVTGEAAQMPLSPDMLGTLAAIPPLVSTSNLWWLLLGGVPLLPHGGPPVPEPPGLAMLAATAVVVGLVLLRTRSARSRRT